MGILLTFMFLWNMLGALILIPALSYFLLRRTGPLVRKPKWRKPKTLNPLNVPACRMP